MSTSEAGASGSSGNVFISYSREDRDFCVQMEKLLRDEGYDPKIDVSGIASGEAWQNRLAEMIAASDTLLVILTDRWVASENCRREYALARTKAKRVISVLPEALKDAPQATGDEAKIRAELSETQNILFYAPREGHGGGFFDGMTALKEYLRRDMDQLRLRRLLELRAKAWKNGEDDLLSGDQLTQAETWLKTEQARAQKGKEKNRVEASVTPEIKTYIEESRNARIRAERAQRRTRSVLAGLAGLVVVAAGILGFLVYQSGEQEKALKIVETDAALLLDAAPAWAGGKANLATLVSGGTAAADAEGAQRAAQWDRLLADAIEQLETGLGNVEKISQDLANPLELEIGLDLASAHYNNEDFVTSAATLVRVDDAAAGSEPDRHAIHFIAKAVTECELGEDKAALIALLEGAPTDVQASYSKETATQWSSPRKPCEGVLEAVCEVTNQCEDYDFSSTPALAESDSADEAEASEEPTLEQLLVSVDRPEPNGEIKEIYLHISNANDRADARNLARVLTHMEYRVLGIELIEASPGRNRSVRYYFDEQGEEAAALVRLCTQVANNLGNRAAWADPDSYRVLSLEGRYDNLRPGRAEIWL